MHDDLSSLESVPSCDTIAADHAKISPNLSPSSPSLHDACMQVQAELQQGQLKQAWERLTALIQEHGQHAAIYGLQGSVLAAAGQHEQALACFRAALALTPDDGQLLASAGGCLHLLGRLPEALQCFRSALQVQCITSLRLIQPPPLPTFDSNAAEQRLWQVLAQLAEAGVHAFATSGTLLGLVREGHLLPFDKDLDIGLPFSEMQAATDVLLRNGWQPIRAPKGMVNPVMLHDGQGLSVDLCGFMAEPGSGAALGGFWLKDAPTDWQRITQYPVLKLQRQRCPSGQSVWAVTDPDAWLASLYGPDWRIPDPDFDTVIAAYNLRGFALLTQCYAFSRIYARWLQGRLKKAAALTRQALRHLPQDALLLQIQHCLAAQQAAGQQ